MADDEAIFDPSLKKKKKKKKTPFDLDAALSESPNTQTDFSESKDNEEDEEEKENKEIDDSMVDLENFGKKKKKKKKPFNLEELDSALPEVGKEDEDIEGNDQSQQNADGLDLDMDFTKSKKKKKKKKDFDTLVGEGDKVLEEDKEADDSGRPVWVGTDRDYTYDELLTRVFDIMREKNPEMVAGEKRRFVMRPPQVVRIGTKKSSFANFAEICKMLHRQPKHLLAFLLAELGTSGSIDGTNQLIIKGRFQQKQIENVLRRYIKEYVTCHTCRSPDTILQKDTRLFFLQCESCGSRCSVASIKSGFQAVTGKRAAIRAKNV